MAWELNDIGYPVLSPLSAVDSLPEAVIDCVCYTGF